jgi:hypothetical protein
MIMDKHTRKRRTLTQMKIDMALGSIIRKRKYKAPFIFKKEVNTNETGLDFKVL